MSTHSKEIGTTNSENIVCHSSISLKDRTRLSISGVIDVENFNDTFVSINTDLGILHIKGEELHISKLNIEVGEMLIDGYIDSLIYSEEKCRNKRGFLSGIFK